MYKFKSCHSEGHVRKSDTYIKSHFMFIIVLNYEVSNILIILLYCLLEM